MKPVSLLIVLCLALAGAAGPATADEKHERFGDYEVHYNWPLYTSDAADEKRGGGLGLSADRQTTTKKVNDERDVEQKPKCRSDSIRPR